MIILDAARRAGKKALLMLEQLHQLESKQSNLVVHVIDECCNPVVLCEHAFDPSAMLITAHYHFAANCARVPFSVQSGAP